LKGEVACCFEDLTIDTMRNRQVRAALDLMARLVKNAELFRKNAELFRRCRFLASEGNCERFFRECAPPRVVDDPWLSKLGN